MMRRFTPLLAGLAVLVGSATCLVGAAATSHADGVTDLQAQARQIAIRLDQLQHESESLAEQFNAAQERADQLTTRIDATRRHLDAARSDIAARRAQVAQYALSAYVDGGSTGNLSYTLDGRTTVLSQRQGYTTLALGDRQELLDRLVAAQRVGEEDLTDLRNSERELAASRAEILDRQQRASALVAEQQQIQAKVQGALADAVAQQQQELAAQAELAARAKYGAPPDSPAGATGPATTVPGQGATTTTVARPGSPTTIPATTAPPSAPPTTTPRTAPPTSAPPAPAPPPPPPSDGTLGQRAAAAAQSQIGTPYSWGGGNSRGPTLGFGPGANTVGYDCSGLALYAWAQAGVPLARVAQSQYDTIRHIPLSSLQPGDLVFYGGSSSSIDHVAIYIGGGSVVHAPSTGSTVRTAGMYLGGYFSWIGAGRPAG